MNARAKAALGFTSLVSPAGSRNLLTKRERYASLLNNLIRYAKRIMHERGGKDFMSLELPVHVRDIAALPDTHTSQRWTLLSHQP